MNIELLSIPNNLIDLIYIACKTCYCTNIDTSIKQEDKLKLINQVMKAGHFSTVEHIQFVFKIDGISRATSHQLVRHRHASYSQRSQRYIHENQFNYIIPEAIKENLELKTQFENLMSDISNFYNLLTQNGIKKEDARAILPNACTTSLIMSLNLRELIHIANLRLCNRAQKEIKECVKNMCNLIIERENWLKDYLVPKCVANGFCNEHIKCSETG